MSVPLPVVIHEQRGVWGRQLRPRLAGYPVRVFETRTTGELAENASRSACPIVVIVADQRPDGALEDLVTATAAAPGALILLLDPQALPLMDGLARELGATHVFAGPVTPPAVVELLVRWFPLARRRAGAEGWWPASPPASPEMISLLAGPLDSVPLPFRLCLTGSGAPAPGVDPP